MSRIGNYLNLVSDCMVSLEEEILVVAVQVLEQKKGPVIFVSALNGSNANLYPHFWFGLIIAAI